MKSQYIGLAFKGETVRIRLTLSDAAVDEIEEAIKLVRRQTPLAEGVQTEVVRSAIKQRLKRDSAPRGADRKKTA